MILLYATCIFIGCDEDFGKTYTKEEMIEILKIKYNTYFELESQSNLEEIIFSIFENEWVLKSNS